MSPGPSYLRRAPSNVKRNNETDTNVEPRRAIFKNGDCNIVQCRIEKAKRLKFLTDLYTTLVDAKWRWTLLIFTVGFFLSWFIFALLWWLIMFAHGDFLDDHLPNKQKENGWTPCILEMYGFVSCFLFSVENQITTGFGARAPTEECPEAIFLMCIQSIYGLLIQAFLIGIVFSKITRPKHRTQTILFSQNAVVCQRDEGLCIMFRVGDMRKSHIIGATIRAQLLYPRRTKEGERINQYQTELTIVADGCNNNIVLIWPLTIVHYIDKNSPFYHLSAPDFHKERFEILVILEGTVETTGLPIQARSSYLSNEIFWGYQFLPILSFNKIKGIYEVNYSRFDGVTAIETPVCSAADLDSFT